MPLPTFPVIEPLPRSRAERLSGKGPSLFRVLKHYSRQLIPNPRFIYKWSCMGAFAVLLGVAVAALSTDYLLNRANQNARQIREARTAEIKRKADLEQARLAIENERKVIASRAIANWETWKGQFTSETDGIACAHGSNLDTNTYSVTCQIGPKGKLPTHQVVCSQGACGTPTSIPPPPPPPEKK